MKDTSDVTLDQFERSLARVLRLLADRGTRSDIAQRSGYDLPSASWSLLEHLETRGALRVSDIAACHGVDISSVTPRLKTLETTGLVRRERSASDARSFIISITETGRHALDSIHAARLQILADVITEADSTQIAAAAWVLSRIADRLASITEPELSEANS